MVQGSNTSQPHLCYFYPNVSSGRSDNSKAEPALPIDLSSAFNTYTIVWAKDRLTFAINGVEYRRLVAGPSVGIPQIPVRADLCHEMRCLRHSQSCPCSCLFSSSIEKRFHSRPAHLSRWLL